MSANTLEQYKKIGLYGGAFSFSIPARFIDISQFRQVPNHQEVFMDAKNDQSIIVEINEMTDLGDSESCRFYYDKLLSDDGAVSPKILSSGTLTSAQLPHLKSNIVSSATFVDGIVTTSKFNEKSENQIRVYMTNFRIPKATSDILVIFNIPVEIGTESSSAGALIMTQSQADEMICKILHTFSIDSLSIFGL